MVEIIDKTREAGFGSRFGTLSDVQGVIIHHTAGGGTVDGVINTFKERGLPAQYVIDQNGTIYQTLPTGAIGQQILGSQPGATRMGLNNSNTIGIEVIGPNDAAWTPAQIAATQALTAQIQQQYGLPPDRVWGHSEVNPNSRTNEGAVLAQAIRANTPYIPPGATQPYAGNPFGVTGVAGGEVLSYPRELVAATSLGETEIPPGPFGADALARALVSGDAKAIATALDAVQANAQSRVVASAGLNFAAYGGEIAKAQQAVNDYLTKTLPKEAPGAVRQFQTQIAANPGLVANLTPDQKAMLTAALGALPPAASAGMVPLPSLRPPPPAIQTPNLRPPNLMDAYREGSVPGRVWRPGDPAPIPTPRLRFDATAPVGVSPSTFGWSFGDQPNFGVTAPAPTTPTTPSAPVASNALRDAVTADVQSLGARGWTMGAGPLSRFADNSARLFEQFEAAARPASYGPVADYGWTFGDQPDYSAFFADNAAAPSAASVPAPLSFPAFDSGWSFGDLPNFGDAPSLGSFDRGSDPAQYATRNSPFFTGGGPEAGAFGEPVPTAYAYPPSAPISTVDPATAALYGFGGMDSRELVPWTNPVATPDLWGAAAPSTPTPGSIEFAPTFDIYAGGPNFGVSAPTAPTPTLPSGSIAYSPLFDPYAGLPNFGTSAPTASNAANLAASYVPTPNLRPSVSPSVATAPQAYTAPTTPTASTPSAPSGTSTFDITQMASENPAEAASMFGYDYGVGPGWTDPTQFLPDLDAAAAAERYYVPQ